MSMLRGGLGRLPDDCGMSLVAPRIWIAHKQDLPITLPFKQAVTAVVGWDLFLMIFDRGVSVGFSFVPVDPVFGALEAWR